MDDQTRLSRKRPKYANTAFWAILLIASLLFFGHFRCPLQEPQESRYAEIPRQMLAEGRWIVPVLHGQPYLDKPPLLYWLVMASYRIFGVEDWAARLVPCVAGWLCVLVTYGWGRRVAGPRAALAGALVLCLSPRFIQLARLLVMDGLLGLEVAVGWAACHLALHEGRLRRAWWLLSAIAAGLGVLTKGPVALLLIAVPVLMYQFLDTRAARFGWRAWTAYVAIVTAVAGPWYLLVMCREPGFAGYFFWEHNVRRFVEPFDHVQPVWFYVPTLFLGLFPWTLLLPALAVFVGSRARQRPAALGFFLLAFAWCLVFFSLAGCKRPYYLLPAMPPLALALGCYLDAAFTRAARRWNSTEKWILHPNGIAGACCVVAMFAVAFTGVHQVLPGYARRFSLRGQVRRLNGDEQLAKLPVFCYPHRWDSVSFYLRRDDVQAFTPDRRAEMIAELQRWPEVLVFVKSDKWLDDLLSHLPSCLEFIPQRRQGFVTAGRVRRRGPLAWAGDAW